MSEVIQARIRPMDPLDQELPNLLCKGTYSKYFWLSGPFSLCAQLCHCNANAATDNMKQMAKVCSNKTLFTKSSSMLPPWLRLMERLLIAGNPWGLLFKIGCKEEERQRDEEKAYK